MNLQQRLVCSYQSITHGATNQSSLNAAWSQGTRNLTVLDPLSGSWVSHESLKGEAQTGWSSRLWSKKGRPCKQWWAGSRGITDLIWCKCGGGRARLSPLAPGDRGLVSHGLVSWQLGPSGSSQQSYPVCLGFVFARSGRQFFRQSVTAETEGEWGDGLTVFTRGVQTLLAHNSAMDSGMLACLCAWVLDLWPWAVMLAWLGWHMQPGMVWHT